MSLCPQLCLLAFRALFENKRAPKRGRNANFQKLLKVPHNGVINSVGQINGKVIQIELNYSDQSNLIRIKINVFLKVIRIELN